MTHLRILAIACLAGTALAGCGKSADETAPGSKAGPDSAQPATLDAMHPSPGLWQMAVKIAGQNGPAPVSKVCYDETLAKATGVNGPQSGEYAKCEQKISRVAGGFEVTATCPGSGGKPVTVTSRVTGDLSKAYTVTVSQPSASSAGSVEIEATRLGDCPADFKPGDMEVQGIRVNMADAARQGAPAPQ